MSTIQKRSQNSEQLFNTSGSYDYDLEAETSELINEVFNSNNYQPVYNPVSTRAKEEHYKQVKEQENKLRKHKLAHHHKIYQNLSDKDLAPSFVEFLTRAQQKIDTRNQWLDSMQQQKIEKQSRTLKDIPDILRGSRQKIQPLYQRCIDLHKDKARKLQHKRIQKHRVESQKIQQLTFHPSVNPSNKHRTFQQYLADKQAWKKQKQQEIQKKRVTLEVAKLNECTFSPMLIAHYNKVNSRLIPGEKVEQRLLRSLERSARRGKGY